MHVHGWKNTKGFWLWQFNTFDVGAKSINGYPHSVATCPRKVVAHVRSTRSPANGTVERVRWILRVNFFAEEWHAVFCDHMYSSQYMYIQIYTYICISKPPMTTVIPVISETLTIFHIRSKILDRCRGLDTKWPDDQVHREKHRGIVDLADLCRCSDTTGVIKPTWKRCLTNSMNRHFEVGHHQIRYILGPGIPFLPVRSVSVKVSVLEKVAPTSSF